MTAETAREKYLTQLEQIRNLNLHWIQVATDGIPEIYLDNHSLQTFRACEGAFLESHIKGYGSPRPIWFLSLGAAVHKMIEIYYKNRKEPSFSIAHWASVNGAQIWHALEMDKKFSDKPEYIKLGGQLGFTTLLLQYATHFNQDNERFRIVGAELYFGKAKEVPLLTDSTLYSFAPFRLYLSGKIDLLIDDGDAICPMDHKTTKDFRGQNPLISYEIQEGMTGYVYATRKIVDKYNISANLPLNRKPANKIWMNFLQIKPEPLMSNRFRRMPLFKTDQQLEDYRLRQIRTASKIFSLITNPDATPDYNTMMCNNWMHGQCGFFPIHRMGSNTHESNLNYTFSKVGIWNPEMPTKEDKEIGEL